MSRVANRVERQQQRTYFRTILREPHSDLGHDAERAFATDKHPAKIESLRLRVKTAEHRDITGWQHNLERQNMGVSDSVGETMRTAGVVRNVAPNGAHLLTRGVGSEVEPHGCEVTGQVQVHHTRLDPRDPVRFIDLEDRVHARHRNNNGGTKGNGATSETSASAARHNVALVLIGQPHDCLYLSSGLGITNRTGVTPVEDRCVVA